MTKIRQQVVAPKSPSFSDFKAGKVSQHFTYHTHVCEYVSRSVISDSVTPWTVASWAPLSMEFSRKAYWSGLPFPCPGDFSHPGIKPRSPTLQTDSLPPEPSGKPLKMGMLALTPCSSGLLSSGREYKLKEWSLELSSSTEAQPDWVQGPGN